MTTRHGKKYIEAAKQVDSTKLYGVDEGVELAKKTSYTNFDGTIEAHLRMGVDSRHADQQVRGVASLPHGLGKMVRVLVFAQGEAVGRAEEVGADVVGGDDLIKQIEGGFLDFDVAIATPDMMGRVGRLGKILGRRGLMPNPKSGTVVQPQDIGRAVGEARKGRVEFRLDRTNLMHVPIGKASFETKALTENLNALLDAVQKAKPSGAKGNYVRSITVCATMGPGVSLDVLPALAAATTSN
ncbi:MAG: 50S ribosomal protein L1 [Alphaproteobacteria bacterium]|nr:50S ribosomal protein L1 [Alphaproteobacteria bacterium]